MSVLDHELGVPSETPGETSGSARNRPRWEKRRMHHVFAADGRAVVVAMDHCITWGVVPGLVDAKDAVSKVIAGGADAVMTTIGMGRTVRDEIGGAGSIVVLDSERSVVSYGIDAALRFGADAVELKVFPGSPADDKLGELRELAAMADACGLPLMAEAIPVSFEDVQAHTVKNIADAARICAEAGADFVKVPFAGTVQEYRSVVEAALVPVLVLGGAPPDDPAEALQLAADAMDAGARGVVFGRNVFQAADPARMVAALCRVVHDGASVERAASVLTA
jgi:class I fructose-bisphosphate aldolase/fructose-bisphosphate aldolase/2-amino-3,7-dideoxy-D-threo-hept-6-ulosonate synthase